MGGICYHCTVVPIAVGEESHFELSAMIMDAVIATTINAITTVNSARLVSPPLLDSGFSVLSDIFCLLWKASDQPGWSQKVPGTVVMQGCWIIP